MMKMVLSLLLAWVLAAPAGALDAGTLPPPDLRPMPQQAQAARLTAELLSRYHYRPVALDDALSARIFDAYLKVLDPERMFFVQADIDRWTDLRTGFDDAILAEDLRAPFAVFNLYLQRVGERMGYARQLLKEGFDFRPQEHHQLTREKENWAASDAQVRDLWRKRVKNDWLRLKLAGKAEQEIVDTLDRRYENAYKRTLRSKGEDAFNAFMHAFTTAVEPHTSYLGPRAAADFDISMRLSLVGIGAVLTEKDDYTTIRELVPGGPATLSGQLKVGDRILGVAQGAGGAMTDIVGWRIDDAVALIRGAPDTIVMLDILPAEAGPDGKHKTVSLVRKKISLEEQAAKKSIIPVRDGATTRRIGVISLPTFYQDFDARRKGDTDFKSATRDVARLLGELRKERVDSVLIDLRNNGGGSLNEAVELTGLFIDKGPVVQQRDAKGKISVASDVRPGVAWDGPLGVLINRGSASASEIFAAAIQDYQRGIVIGEPSFGKGTVQTLIDLDQIVKGDKQRLGEVKLTIAQFFRIDGGTTQLRGVEPDILFPSLADASGLGEARFPNALPWVRVRPADYVPAGDLDSLRPLLRARHEARVAKDIDFRFLREDLAEFERLRQRNLISLNEAERRQEREAREARSRARTAQRNAAGGTLAAGDAAVERPDTGQDDGLQVGERRLDAELATEKARKEARDVLLIEAVNILGDTVALLQAGTRFADQGKPAPTIPPGRKQDLGASRYEVR